MPLLPIFPLEVEFNLSFIHSLLHVLSMEQIFIQNHFELIARMQREYPEIQGQHWKDVCSRKPEEDGFSERGSGQEGHCHEVSEREG